MSPPDFVSQFRAADPRLNAVVDQRLADNDELLLHLLVADLRRQAEAAHESRDHDLRDAVLVLVDSALTNGDAGLRTPSRSRSCRTVDGGSQARRSTWALACHPHA